MLVHWSYVYCYILWILAVIYIVFPLKYSPLISLIVAGIYTTFSQIFFNHYIHISKKILVLSIEYLMIIMVALKSKELMPLFINKSFSTGLIKSWNNIKPSILINILLFGIYLIYLGVNRTSFYDIYYIKLPASHDDSKENVWEYFKRRLMAN
jgi:hypothetical protein